MPRVVSALPSSGSSPGPIHWATLVLEISCGSPELLTGCVPNKESDLGTTDAPESRIGTKMPLSPGCPTSDSTGLNQIYYLTPPSQNLAPAEFCQWHLPVTQGEKKKKHLRFLNNLIF